MVTMFVGYMLLDSGGTPLVTSSIVDVLGNQEVLFAGAMTAINSVVAEVTKTKVKYVRTEKYHLYFAYSSDLILVLISDREDSRLRQLADMVLNEVLRTVDDSSKLVYDFEAKRVINGIIRKVIVEYLPSVSNLIRIAEMIIAFVNSVGKGRNIGLGKILFLPGELESAPVSVKPSTGKVRVEGLIESFLEGNFERVVKDAPALFESDHARILYAKAALKLNSFSPEVKAPPLSQVYSVILGVEDGLAKELLMAELRRFLEPGTYYEKEGVVEDNLFRISEKFKEHGNHGTIYMALTMPTGKAELLELAELLMGDQYPYFKRVLKTSPSFMKASILRSEGFAEWNVAIGNIKYELSNVPSNLAEVAYNYLIALQFVLLNNLMEKDMDLESGRKILNENLAYVEKWYGSLKKLSKRVPNDILAANYWFTYNALTSLLLLAIPVEEARKLVPTYGKKVVDVVKWLLNAAKENRISVDMYVMSMMGMLAAYSRLSFFTGKSIPDLPYYVKQIVTPELARIGKSSLHHYLHVRVDVLEALGYLANFITIDSVRRKLLEEVAVNLEETYRTSRYIPIVSTLAALNAIKFYTLCGTENAKERARKIAEETSSINDFFTSLTIKCTEINEVPKETPTPYDIFI